MGVMHEHIVDRVSILAYPDCIDVEAVAHQTFLIILSEEHLLAVMESDCPFGAYLFI